jgi:hypothetical protein
MRCSRFQVPPKRRQTQPIPGTASGSRPAMRAQLTPITAANLLMSS